MKHLELFVGLKIPDNTCITAFHTLERMGFKELKSLERKDYFKFSFEGDEIDFKNNISQVDLIVNANKNTFDFELKQLGDKINAIVKDHDNGAGLLNLLKERLGFKNIKKVEQGVLWVMDIEGNDKKIAEKITKELLMNENYQEFEFI